MPVAASVRDPSMTSLTDAKFFTSLSVLCRPPSCVSVKIGARTRHCETRRPRRPERQGPQPRRPVNDYFHDIDYFDYFLYGPKTVVPNSKILDPMCDPNPSPIYHICVSYVKSCMLNQHRIIVHLVELNPPTLIMGFVRCIYIVHRSHLK